MVDTAFGPRRSRISSVNVVVCFPVNIAGDIRITRNKEGLYAPLTDLGELVVDGVYVSR